MFCNKCNSPSSVILRKKDHYCNDCFIIGTNHKFRACIGKNKILSKNDKVLICASAGPGSSVLLNLVHYGLSLDLHKKLRIVPVVLHVSEDTNMTSCISLMKLCRLYEFNIYITHISDYIKSNKKLPEVNVLPGEDLETNNKFQSILSSMPATARNDFVKKVKRSLFIHYAELLNCRYVFTAETTTRLAINLLSNLAIGRGSQVQNDIGFIDSGAVSVKILRPMRDISQEELDYYINIKRLNPIIPTEIKDNSLQAVIGSFVTELQGSFQSTISTVCKTADKIGATSDDTSIKRSCAICMNPLTKRGLKLSALDATNFSRTVSFGKPLDNQNDTMFPYIDQYLCYSCSRNYSEMKDSNLNFMSNLLQNE